MRHLHGRGSCLYAAQATNARSGRQAWYLALVFMRIASKLTTRTLVTSAVLIDIIIVIVADLLSFSLRYGIDVRVENFEAYRRIAIFVVLLRIICFYVFGLYEKPKYKTNLDNLLNIIKATTISSLIIVAAAFFARAFAYPRSVIILSWLITTTLIMAWRAITRSLINRLLGREYFVSNLLIIGTDQNAIRLMLQLTRRAGMRCRLVGYVATGSEEPRVNPKQILGTIDDIPELLKRLSIDEAVISSPNLPRDKVALIFSYFTNTDIILKTVPDLYEAVIGRMATASADRVPLVELTTTRYGKGWYSSLKRVLDIGMALVALIVFGPLLMLPIAVIIKLTSEGPVLHTQERAGLYGRPFVMYKFRTMLNESERDTGPVWATANDRRVTSFGRFLRKTRLDELPQFINVLRGEMSVVGPRPERPHFVRALMRSVPFYTERLEVKPGITGWAQVNYKYASCLESNAEKLIYDLFYIENMGLGLDLWIIFKTLAVILSGSGI